MGNGMRERATHSRGPHVGPEPWETKPLYMDRSALPDELTGAPISLLLGLSDRKKITDTDNRKMLKIGPRNDNLSTPNKKNVI